MGRGVARISRRVETSLIGPYLRKGEPVVPESQEGLKLRYGDQYVELSAEEPRISRRVETQHVYHPGLAQKPSHLNLKKG